MFHITAIFAIPTILLVTLSAPFGMTGIFAATTAMFIFMNAQMVPGTALVTSAANLKLRGTFIALNASVRSAAMGIATFVGALVISRDAQRLVQYFWVNALLGTIATVFGLMLATRLKLYGSVTTKPEEGAIALAHASP